MYYATGMPGWMRAGYGYPAYYAPEPSAEEETGMLKEQAEALKEELNDIQERIKTLEKAQKQEKDQ
jgi:5-bromo-4-chloroindolyl phosphate hydrolysis protein